MNNDFIMQTIYLMRLNANLHWLIAPNNVSCVFLSVPHKLKAKYILTTMNV
jgi:hypothetical protein